LRSGCFHVEVTPFLRSVIGFQLITAILVVALVIISVWTMWSALRALGRQWSLQARVLEDHKLVREGPYRFVRHPIYSGILGMIVAGGLAWSIFFSGPAWR